MLSESHLHLPMRTTCSLLKRPSLRSPNTYIKLERETGIEPATFSLARRCSTTEPLPHISCVRMSKISYLWCFVNCFLHHPLPDKTNSLCLANRLLLFPHEVSHRHLSGRDFVWSQYIHV